MSRTDLQDPLRLVVVGGGFTGAVLAIHAIRATTRALDIVVLEPRAELGLGIAFGTSDLSHRMNVPSDRMDIAKAESETVSAWFRSHGILPDLASEDGTGRAYVPRLAYGAYIRDVLARTVAAAESRVRLHHLQTTATAVRPDGDLWQIACDSGAVIEADRVALCFGHAVPALPFRSATARRPPLGSFQTPGPRMRLRPSHRMTPSSSWAPGSAWRTS